MSRNLMAKLVGFLCLLALATPAEARRREKASLPRAIEFALHRDNEPDNDGLFTCRAVVTAPICDVKMKLKVDPADGIQVLEQPKKLHGRLRKGRTVTFSFAARIVEGTKLPVALRMELLYRASPKGLRKYVTSGEGKYAFPVVRDRALTAIVDLSKEHKIERMFDCVLFTKNTD